MNMRIVLVVIALAMLWAGALAAEKSEYSAWFEKAQELTNNGSLREANLTHENVLMLCDESLARNPDDAQVWHDRGLALAYLGKREAANESFSRSIEILNRTIEGNPEGAADAWWLMGQDYELSSMPEAALRAYDKVTETNSSKALGAWIRISDLLLQQLAYNESVKAFDMAAKLMPDKVERINMSLKEENSSIALHIWGGNGGIYRMTIGRYNESSQEYDHTIQMTMDVVYASSPMAKILYPFNLGARIYCCYCYVPWGGVFTNCASGYCPNFCPYTKRGCCAWMLPPSCPECIP